MRKTKLTIALVVTLWICFVFTGVMLIVQMVNNVAETQEPVGSAQEPGTRWYTGNGAPTELDPEGARSGDFYLDLDTMNLYTYTDDEWNLCGSLKGEDGQNGAEGTHWYYGSEVPTASIPAGAKEGDFYFRTISGLKTGYAIYRKGASGWEKIFEEATSVSADDIAAMDSLAIADSEDLVTIAELVKAGVTFEGVEITLEQDIDLAGTEWTPIGNGNKSNLQPFKGTFDGNGKTISGLVVADDGADNYSGFFAAVNGATIKDLTIENANVTTKGKSGVLAGIVMGSTTIEGVTVSGSVVSDDAAGGLVGYIRNTDKTFTSQVVIKDCINDASVTSQSKTAGIAAHVEYLDTLVLEGCVNNGAIITYQDESTQGLDEDGKAADADAAGLLGYVMYIKSVNLSKCENNGDITSTMLQGGGKVNVGGILSTAHNNNGTAQTFFVLEQCVNNGTIVVNNLSDETNTTNTKVGGIVGSTSSIVTLTSCQSLGDIEVYAPNKTESASDTKHSDYLLAVGGLMGNMDGGTLNVTGETLIECSLLARCEGAPRHIRLGAVVGTSAIVNINADATGHLQANVTMNWVDEDQHGLIGSTPNKESVIRNVSLEVALGTDTNISAEWDENGD